jgi:S1-C subfamily serine protease
MAINGMAVTDMDQLNSYSYKLEVGDVVQLQLYRSRSQFILEVKLTEDKG